MKTKTKTCGECKHCSSCCSWVKPDINANSCEDFEPKVITNGDKIRQMRNDELVGFLDCSACLYAGHDCANQDCTEGKLAWLKQEAKDE